MADVAVNENGTEAKALGEDEIKVLVQQARQQRADAFKQEVAALEAKYRCRIVPEIVIRGTEVSSGLIIVTLE